MKLLPRRMEIEKAFLDDLTRLTRKYGLMLVADTKGRDDFIVPSCYLEVADSLAHRYHVGRHGIHFARADETLQCSEEEARQFAQARQERLEEDKERIAYVRAQSRQAFPIKD